jgi:hypothetical protein
MFRPLATSETDAIRRVAEMLPAPAGQRLLQDLERATVDVPKSTAGRTVFAIAGYERPRHGGQHSFGVWGKLVDRDGTELSFDVFADQNDRLLELELIRWGEGEPLDPDWSTLTLF